MRNLLRLIRVHRRRAWRCLGEMSLYKPWHRSGRAVRRGLFCSASHSIESGAHAVLVGCGDPARSARASRLPGDRIRKGPNLSLPD